MIVVFVKAAKVVDSSKSGTACPKDPDLTVHAFAFDATHVQQCFLF